MGVHEWGGRHGLCAQDDRHPRISAGLRGFYGDLFPRERCAGRVMLCAPETRRHEDAKEHEGFEPRRTHRDERRQWPRMGTDEHGIWEEMG